mmetsp:Transcript_31220/g.73249  ORF Transcript_31220/g.73249 Transcript_31220/m.73249 type:complete len:165 (+) Transcript_31220:667-1161(+)
MASGKGKINDLWVDDDSVITGSEDRTGRIFPRGPRCGKRRAPELDSPDPTVKILRCSLAIHSVFSTGEKVFATDAACAVSVFQRDTASLIGKFNIHGMPMDRVMHWKQQECFREEGMAVFVVGVRVWPSCLPVSVALCVFLSLRALSLSVSPSTSLSVSIFLHV